jgi:hypothetical protein
MIIELIQDDELLRIERKKAKTEGRGKYQGYSKEEMAPTSAHSFEDKWSTSRIPKFDEEKGKEVNSFDFDGNERSASPELGIRAVVIFHHKLK